MQRRKQSIQLALQNLQLRVNIIQLLGGCRSILEQIFHPATLRLLLCNLFTQGSSLFADIRTIAAGRSHLSLQLQLLQIELNRINRSYRNRCLNRIPLLHIKTENTSIGLSRNGHFSRLKCSRRIKST